MNEFPEEWLPKILQVEYFNDISNPRFIEIDNLIILATHYTKKSYAKWKKTLKSHNSPKDLERLENTLNHIHLSDIVEDPELQKEVGEYLKKIWVEVLERQFISKSFECQLAPVNDGWELIMWSRHF